MKRLIIVYNPKSSRFSEVEKVFDELRKLSGYLIGKYEIKPTDVDDNAEYLAKILLDGDLVLTAGGDATAAVGFNAAMLTDKKVTFSALALGNFNDTAATMGKAKLADILRNYEMGKTRKFWPLEVKINGELWRYAVNYLTVGMFAEATEIFNQNKTRKKLQSRKDALIFSLAELTKWYERNKRRDFLPSFSLNGTVVEKGTSDYIAVNGRRMAKIMKASGNGFLDRKFESGTIRSTKFVQLMNFMMKSVFLGVPAKETKEDVLEFFEPVEIEIQAEGEYQKIKDVKKIEVKKADKFVETV